MQVVSVEKDRQFLCQTEKVSSVSAKENLDDKKIEGYVNVVTRDYHKYKPSVKTDIMIRLVENMLGKRLDENRLIRLFGHIYRHSRHRRDEPLTEDEEKVYSWLLRHNINPLRPYNWFLASRSPEYCILKHKQGKMDLRTVEKFGRKEILKTLHKADFDFILEAKKFGEVYKG